MASKRMRIKATDRYIKTVGWIEVVKSDNAMGVWKETSRKAYKVATIDYRDYLALKRAAKGKVRR